MRIHISTATCLACLALANPTRAQVLALVGAPENGRTQTTGQDENRARQDAPDHPRPDARPDARPATTQATAPDIHSDDRTSLQAERYDMGQDDGADCALGAVCIGPVLNLGVINPIGAGLHARIGDHLGLGVDYQFLPEITIANAQTSVSLFTVEGRVYPFGGAFFLSGGFAYQVLSATASTQGTDPSGRNVSISAEGTVSLPMLKVGIGFFGHDGLVMGIDLAAEFPLAGSHVEFGTRSSGLSEEEQQQIAQLEQEVQSTADQVLDVMPVLFQVNLLRLGYVF